MELQRVKLKYIKDLVDSLGAAGAGEGADGVQDGALPVHVCFEVGVDGGSEDGA
jgi:hypothetical protein